MEDKIIKETKYFTTYLRPDGSTYLVFKRQPVELNTNLERYTQPTDKTTVAPKIDPKVKDNAKNASEEHKRNLLATGEYVEHNGLLVHIPRNNAIITADTRTDWLRKKSQEDYLNHLRWEERRKQKELETKVGLGLALGAGIMAALATPAAPVVNGALAAYSAGSLANLYVNGTLGFNLETGINTLGLVPGLSSVKTATAPIWAPIATKTFNNIRNYRMARAFDNIVKSEIKRKDLFNKNFPLYTYKPEPYNNKLGLPESDPNTFYHYINYPSLGNINGEGVVRFSNFTIKPKYNGSDERIWWDKGNVPRGGDVILSSKSKYIDEHVLSHPEKYSPYRGNYLDSYYTSKDVPINEVNIYTKDPFTGYYNGPHNTITYNPSKLIEGKTSLRFFERSPLNINPKGSWTHPFKNNMGLLDHRTSSVTGNNFGDFIAEGSEQMVFGNPNNINEVLKIYSDVGQSSLNNLRKFVKLYQTRNNVPFLLPTTFVGHVTDKDGLLYPVFSQQKILKTLQNDLLDWNTILPRLNTLLKSVGFNKGNGYYRRGTQEIWDIQPQNMIELSNGLFRFIDAFPQGFRKGGKLIKKTREEIKK